MDQVRRSKRVLRDQKRAAKRRERLSEEWTRDDFMHDLRVASSPMTDAINRDPKDAARLAKSRQQVKEGEVHWGVEDDDETTGSDAGE